MKNLKFGGAVPFLAVLVLTAVATPMGAQSSLTPQGDMARAIVTVQPKRGKELRPIPRQAVVVETGNKAAEVASWTPLVGEKAGLQLLILLDDSSAGRLGSQLEDLKTFVVKLPPSTEVGIGYMRNGSALMTQDFTIDHAAAAKTFRLPMAVPGGNASPYFALQDVIKRWPKPQRAMRREILMVTDGVDRYSGARFDPSNPYLEAAVKDAQRSGVLVYSIYYRGAGMLDSDQGVVLGGQNYLVQLASETGGKCYLQGLSSPVSFAPFLEDFARLLQNQYELGFLTTYKPESGLVPLKLKIDFPGVSITAPTRVGAMSVSEGAGSQ